MPALAMVALSPGLPNFAAAIGIGVAGVDARTRVRAGVVFGVFEAGMPILGLAPGHGLAGALGRAGLALACRSPSVGYGSIQALRTDGTGAPAGQQQLGQLLITGIALSIDNLAVGFAPGTYQVSFPLAAVIIGTVSVARVLAGLELGARIGIRAGQRGELLGGLVLIGPAEAVAGYCFQYPAMAGFPAVEPGGRGSTGPAGCPSWS